MSVKKDLFVAMGTYLMNTIKNLPPELNLPDLKGFDKQMGQFVNPELSYALPLPFILMTYKPFQWATVGKQQQRGDGVLSFDIYFENYADSFTGSINSTIALQFFDFTEVVHQALQGLILPGIIMTKLERVGDNEDTAEDMIITSTIDYATTISDIATDYSRNFEMADAGVTVTKVRNTSRPAPDTFTDGFIIGQ